MYPASTDKENYIGYVGANSGDPDEKRRGRGQYDTSELSYGYSFQLGGGSEPDTTAFVTWLINIKSE